MPDLTCHDRLIRKSNIIIDELVDYHGKLMAVCNNDRFKQTHLRKYILFGLFLWVMQVAYPFMPMNDPPDRAYKSENAINFKNDSGHVKIGAAFQTGFLGDPEHHFQHLIQGFPKGVNVNLQFDNGNMPLSGSDIYGFTKGLDLFWVDLANRDQLGYIAGVIPYFSFTMFDDRLISPDLSLGIGVAYANQPHHHITNYKNTLIGSHFNAALSSRLRIHVRLLDHMYWQTGLSVLHVSNGNTKIPNNGMNLFSIESGLSYRLFTPRASGPVRSYSDNKNDQHVYLTSAISLTGHQEGVQPGYNYFTVMTEWVTPVNPVFGIGLGMDFTHNNAGKDKVAYEQVLPPANNQVGIKGITAVSLNQLTVMFQMGIINDANIRVYNWLILRHELYKKLFLNMSYRSYGFNGGLLSWGLGIKL